MKNVGRLMPLLCLTLGTLISAEIPRTDGWFELVFVEFGRVQVDKAGVYQLTLEPADTESWKAVNVYQLQIAPAQ